MSSRATDGFLGDCGHTTLWKIVEVGDRQTVQRRSSFACTSEILAFSLILPLSIYFCLREQLQLKAVMSPSKNKVQIAALQLHLDQVAMLVDHRSVKLSYEHHMCTQYDKNDHPSQNPTKVDGCQMWLVGGWPGNDLLCESC